MIKSRRARRMERNHNKAKTPGLNLVALMDIFTLLVFFLLVNSSSTQHMPTQKNIRLPVSSSKILPQETLVIEITRTDILIQGKAVARVADVLENSDETIPALKNELLELSLKSDVAPAQGQVKEEHKITIMGDENISYDLIRKSANQLPASKVYKDCIYCYAESSPEKLDEGNNYSLLLWRFCV